jgi:tRNA threonylcarbamoyladenosine biosynthesis protein TsaB
MILAIETATEVCSVALVNCTNIVSQRSVHEKNIHSEQLMILIEEVLKEAQISISGIDGIAISIGPGSFTGLRIGLSAAKGLGFALTVPIIPVPTLDGIAEEYRRKNLDQSPYPFCAMIDAKREESYFAFYNIFENDIHRTGEYSIKSKNEIYTDASSVNAIIVQPMCNASSVGLLAERNFNSLVVKDFEQLEPMYIRNFVATTPK